MTPEKNGNSRGWRNFTTIGFVLSLAFIFLDRVITPGVNSGKLADTVNGQAQDIAVLKDVITTLRPLPTEVTGLKIMVDSIKRQMDRLEVTLEKRLEKR